MRSDFTIGDLEGQETASIYLSNFAEDPESIPRVLLFHGPDGVGKWTAAERLGRLLLCQNFSSCGLCDSCKAFMRGLHPDYIQFPENQNIRIGDQNDEEPEPFTVRWLLWSRLPYRPHLSSKRVVVFPDASKINHAAEATLLKTLEEPLPFNYVILIVNELDKIKKTIQSRSVKIPFGFLPQNAKRAIASKTNIETREYFGGSLQPLELEENEWTEWEKNISEHAHDPRLLLKLEYWVKKLFNEFKSPKSKTDPVDFLDFVTLVLLKEYRQNNPESNLPRIGALFEFKEKLHYNVPSLEPYLLSRLFLHLTTNVDYPKKET